MNPETILAGTASLFLALGDKTRLRLLNLLRDREVCVSSFTGILGQSQPLVSRHLAYLRNSGIVEARREGKWMHYSVSAQLDENSSRLLTELFKWMESQDGLQADREKYRSLMGEPVAQPAVSKGSARKPRSPQTGKTPVGKKLTVEPTLITESPRPFDSSIPEVATDEYAEPDQEAYEEAYQEEESYAVVHHNELEDFLL